MKPNTKIPCFGSASGIFFLTLLWILGAQFCVFAADYPVRPVTLICPFPPGGSRDIVGRMFAASAEKFLGKPLIVLNKPGASGVIGTQAVIQAQPDGYTFGLVSTSDVNIVEAEIANGRKPNFTRHDFILLGALTRSPVQLVVPNASPWKTVADLVRDLKARPNHYTFCSGGLYNVTHISTELFLRATGTSAWLVPFKGAGDCLPAVVGAQIDFTTQFLSSTMSMVQARRLRTLAVLGNERVAPDVPTTKELGIDAQVYQMIGLSAPKGTPPGIVERIRETIKNVAEDAAFIKLVEGSGDAVRYTSGEELTRQWDVDSEQLAKLLPRLFKEVR